MRNDKLKFNSKTRVLQVTHKNASFEIRFLRLNANDHMNALKIGETTKETSKNA